MEKKWNKIKQGKFVFTINNATIGEMAISSKSLSSKAICTVGNEKFTIQRTGFWKNALEVIDNSGKIIAKVYNEKWYVSSSILEYKNKKYKIILRNNPLAELVIFDKEAALLSYGIKNDKKEIKVQICMTKETNEVLFDFILWYLFVPIISEQSDDNFIFQMLLSV